MNCNKKSRALESPPLCSIQNCVISDIRSRPDLDPVGQDDFTVFQLRFVAQDTNILASSIFTVQ